MSDQSAIYEEHILGHIEQPYHRGLFALATHRQRIDNPVCGDSVQLEVRISDDGTIAEAWFTGTGCIISQAAASMLVEYIEGRSVEDLIVQKRHRSETGTHSSQSQPEGFTAQDMLDLFQARLTPLRQRCCLLAWEALHQLLARLTRE